MMYFYKINKIINYNVKSLNVCKYIFFQTDSKITAQ